MLRRPLDSAQYTSIAYTERLDEIGAAPSIGTVGDSFDNAMAESVIGLFKTELHRNPAALAANGGPWRGLDDLEVAACGWVSWFNEERIHGELDDLTPAELEADYRQRSQPTGLRTPTDRASGKPRPIHDRRHLVVLTHLRQGISLRASGAIFGIDEKSVRNYRDEAVRLPAVHGCQPPNAARPIRTLEDLRSYLDELPDETCMVDGTHVERSMPSTSTPNAPTWTGKDRDHVAKGTRGGRLGPAPGLVRGQPQRRRPHP